VCLNLQGARVWLRDKELVWIPAEVVNGLSGKKITIQTEEEGIVSKLNLYNIILPSHVVGDNLEHQLPG